MKGRVQGLLFPSKKNIFLLLEAEEEDVDIRGLRWVVTKSHILVTESLVGNTKRSVTDQAKQELRGKVKALASVGSGQIEIFTDENVILVSGVWSNEKILKDILEEEISESRINKEIFGGYEIKFRRDKRKKYRRKLKL